MDSKLVYMSPMPFLPTVVGSFLNFQVIPLIEGDDELYFTCMIPVVIWCMNALSYVDLGLPLPHFKFVRDISGFACPNLRIYVETAVVVVISYVSLLAVNWSYIWLAVFPAIAIGFIVALRSELSRLQGGPQQQSGDGDDEVGAGSGGGDREGRKALKRAEALEAVALVPYWVLCMMGHFHADRFAVSQFLLFFSFVLGALTLMMARLALTGAAPGAAPASVFLRKASLVLLLVAAHALAAELLGERVVLLCLPEIAPVLLWLSVHLDRDDGAVVSSDKIRLNRSALVLLGAALAAVFALLQKSMDESVLSWLTQALVSSGVSGLLTYYGVFMLCQWPGQDGTATPLLKEMVKLLKFWADVLLIAAATLLIFTSLAAVQLVLQEPMAAASAGHVVGRLRDMFLRFTI